MGSKHKKANVPQIIETTFLDKVALATVIVSAAVVPLIVRLHEVKLSEATQQVYTGAATQLDFFSYNKAAILNVCAAILLLYGLSRVLQHRKMELIPQHIPLGFYTLTILASSFASGIYSEIAWNGFPDRYEGATVLICYVLLTFTVSIIVRNEKQMESVLWAVFAMTLIIGCLGLTQFFDFDFLKTTFGRNLMLPAKHKNLMDTLQFNFGKGEMYTTVYNPNFLGSLSALLLPVAAGMYYRFVGKKKPIQLVSAAVFTLMAFILWLGGMSRAGLVGGGIAVLLLLIFLGGRIIRHWKYSLVLFVLLAVIYSGMDAYSGYSVSREFFTTLPTSMSNVLVRRLNERHPIVVEKTAEAPEPTADILVPPINTANSLVRKTALTDNTFIFETDTEALKLKLDANTLSLDVKDGKDQPLSVKNEPNKEINGKQVTLMTFENPQYADYSMYLIDGGIVFTWKGKSIALLVRDGQLLYQSKTNSAVASIDNPPFIGFKGSERFASSRGYIWSRSFPLLKDTIFIGHGPDTFAAYFPQNDLASKMNWLEGPNDIVDKPHNWYIQLAINTGIFSLLSVLVLLAWYGLQSMKTWWKDDGSAVRTIGASLLCGIIGYCVAGIFNDSVVSVAPVFWTLLGLGLALLQIAKRTGAAVKPLVQPIQTK